MVEKIVIVPSEKKIYYTVDSTDKVIAYRDKVECSAYVAILGGIKLSDYKEMAETHALITSGVGGDFMTISKFCDYHSTSRMSANAWIRKYGLKKKVIAGHVVIDNNGASPGAYKCAKGKPRFRNNLSLPNNGG